MWTVAGILANLARMDKELLATELRGMLDVDDLTKVSLNCDNRGHWWIETPRGLPPLSNDSMERVIFLAKQLANISAVDPKFEESLWDA